MFKDNPLLAQLKQDIRENLPTVEGRVKASDKGYGFLEVDRKTSHFIAPPFMKKVMHGDIVSAIVRTEGDKTQAEPEKLVEGGLTRFVAKLGSRKDRWFVQPESAMVNLNINAKAELLKPAKLAVDDWVLAELTRHPLKGDNSFFASIVHKVADGNDPYAQWQCTLARHNLPVVEPDLPEQIDILDEGIERVDLTAVEMFTIDGATTKDMDDALAIETTDNGWKLTVAIADPTAYIEADSTLDKAARDRGFTVYLPARNVSMIPSRLSEELCSLMPHQERPAMVAELFVSATGELIGEPTICLATIKSHYKLAYEDVSDWLEQAGDWAPENDALATQLKALEAMTKARSAWRNEHAITFPDRPDFRFELNEDCSVKTIHVEHRRTANSMIEESMIVANIAVSSWLRQRVERAIYNVHAGFEDETLDVALALIHEFEGSATEESLKSLAGFCELRRWLDAQPTAYLDSRLRKFQSYSEIQVTPGQHFGMGLDCYGTWTSPIRKYGDMINHRLIKAVLRGDETIDLPTEDDAEHLTELRKKNRFAERDLSDVLYARYLQADLNNKTVFNAEIFDINRGGMRARVLDNGSMVFIPASTLHSDKKQVQVNADEGMITVAGEVAYRVADSVKVVLSDIKEQNRSLVANVVPE
ncbi:exoribonuclease II [Echinimonas agarilytica]|uniref:Exoribonuclease II n=1 Tax=Echinimonas agarilytica TaxID=1215918 RepID=A0AA41W7N9_9GAMM|nr:exoribonuclease II [Echinimonas agarilytica]MCM2680787.1 exoribonuclease II [Echinimonas agarilytica]